MTYMRTVPNLYIYTGVNINVFTMNYERVVKNIYYSMLVQSMNKLYLRNIF